MIKRFLLTILATIFLLTAFTTAAISTINLKTTPQSNILKVDDEGEGDYKTIQKAITNAQPGDIINVYSGTYKEHITITKQITLIGIPFELGNGGDTGKPTIDGSNIGNVIEITADRCVISGLEIINAGIQYKAGIYTRETNHHIITDNTLRNNCIGIWILSSNNCTITSNTVQYNIFGINLNNPNNHTINNNTFQNSGLVISGQPAEILTNTIENNTVNNRPIYLYVNQENITISNTDAGQIIIINCHNLTIENMTIHNTTIGILIQLSSHLTIRNNKLRDIHRGGISLHADHCNVYNNSFINCSYSCYLEGGKGFNIHHNNFIKCYKHDQPVYSYIKKHQIFMDSTDVTYDNNYWDDWIGLKIPLLKCFPKIIFGFLKPIHKQYNIFPIIKLDKNPALEPYEI